MEGWAEGKERQDRVLETKQAAKAAAEAAAAKAAAAAAKAAVIVKWRNSVERGRSPH
jgi:hypothetical protein